MCWCDPNIRAICCGKPNCHPVKFPFMTECEYETVEKANELLKSCQVDRIPISKRGEDWTKFQLEVFSHIEHYTVPQYGDKGQDLASEYSAEDCIKQVKKYAARFGANARPGQEKLDLLKMAHYIQMAWESLNNEKG